MLDKFKEDMMMKYEMTDLGLLHHFLDMGVVQTNSSIFIHQKKYASSLLNKFGLNECKTVTTPLVATKKLTKGDGSGATSEEQYRSIVGSLLYLTATRQILCMPLAYLLDSCIALQANTMELPNVCSDISRELHIRLDEELAMSAFSYQKEFQEKEDGRKSLRLEGYDVYSLERYEDEGKAWSYACSLRMEVDGSGMTVMTAGMLAIAEEG
ncbi:hypothetical protein L3X38_027011 [Prunus dulcis]|uniref:Reverse transcriptase Ty1/copia-type domain-containing protein n=1 Tax=Prunus dulcis TaxID=3755 RepID=A0AAD4VM17_PRUDU|nr:hypothetical protein L3X38_027011 [Prunus dulcis]